MANSAASKSVAIAFLEWFGDLGAFIVRLVLTALGPPYEGRELLRQIDPGPRSGGPIWKREEIEVITILKRAISLSILALLSPAMAQACWTGHFTGLDTSGYSIDIQLTERNGRVEGGYSYFHQAMGKAVRAVILDAVIDGDALKGRWKQVEGIPAEGSFRWSWLPGESCKAFEGAFDGVRYWGRMNRSGSTPQPPPPPASPPPPPPAVPPSQACWTGHFTGLDTSGYAIDIELTERDGRVEGGYGYFHKAMGKAVRAVILDAVIDGDALKGRWKQVEGIPAEGAFRWNWLPGESCKAFEGAFDGVRYWGRMNRSGSTPQPPPPPASPPPPPPAVPPSQACWTGHFTGLDTSGYAIDIELTERNGRVEGGYSYFHKAMGKAVRAVILDAVIDGDALKGRWKQVEGIPAEGSFRWSWLPGESCKAFEGAFDGVRYWGRMNR